MNDLDDVHRRMRISNLQARCELYEIEAAALTRVIASPLTSAQRQEEAIEHRNVALVKLSEVRAQLEEMGTL